jgi:hypothetical protein
MQKNLYVISFGGGCGIFYRVEVTLDDGVVAAKLEAGKNARSGVEITDVEVFESHKGKRIGTLITALVFYYERMCGVRHGVTRHGVTLNNISMLSYVEYPKLNEKPELNEKTDEGEVDHNMEYEFDLIRLHLHKWAAGTVMYLRAFKLAGFQLVSVAGAHGRQVDECLEEYDQMLKLCSNRDNMHGCNDAINKFKETYDGANLRVHNKNLDEEESSSQE